MMTAIMAGVRLSKQFEGFTRIGSHQVQKHIDSDNGLAEQIKQYNLKGSEKQEQE